MAGLKALIKATSPPMPTTTLPGFEHLCLCAFNLLNTHLNYLQTEEEEEEKKKHRGQATSLTDPTVEGVPNKVVSNSTRCTEPDLPSSILAAGHNCRAGWHSRATVPRWIFEHDGPTAVDRDTASMPRVLYNSNTLLCAVAA